MKRLMNAFTANFGNQKVLQWKLLNDGTLKAIFINNGRQWEAVFECNGALLTAGAVKEKA